MDSHQRLGHRRQIPIQPVVGSAGGDNEALLLASPGGRFEISSTPRPTAAPGEVLVRVRAVAVNPVDAIPGLLRRAVFPQTRYPTVIGSDLAGEVVEVGTEVTHLHPGQRVLGFAAGAFQRYVTVSARVCTPLPDEVSFEQAAAVPLGLATAAAGLFEPDQLALPLPTTPIQSRQGVVLVWGASTSVGLNAVQLARASGFVVLATAGRHNHDLVRSLGARAVFDYREADVDHAVLNALRGQELAGTIAIGKKSLTHALHVTRRSPGAKRIASAHPDPATRVRALLALTRGIHVSTIWGGTPVRSPVGPAIFQDFLTTALQDGRLRPAPTPVVVGRGLASVPTALDTLRAGVSAAKIVVSLD